MFDIFYLKEQFKIIPLTIIMDFSEVSLEQALIQLNFDLKKDYSYILHIGRENINELIKLKAGYNLFNIEVKIEDSFEDEWYIGCKDIKTIVYSLGV